jgi:hypothetical protein
LMPPEDTKQVFQSHLRERGWPDGTSPSELLERWLALVDQAENGYRWTVDEYWDEVGPRDLLEFFYSDPRLYRDPSYDSLRTKISAADARLRRLLRTDLSIGKFSDPWWQRGLPSYGRDQYREDMARMYGIVIPEPSGP